MIYDVAQNNVEKRSTAKKQINIRNNYGITDQINMK